MLLADFCGAPRRVLAKTGALRQTQLPVSSAGRGRCVCPCSASAVSAAGSASAAQPSTLLSVSPLPLRGSPLALSRFLRRAAAGACKNRSAAPASPRCFCRRQRSAQLPPFGGSRPSTAPSGCKLRSSCTCPSSLTASVCLPSEKVVPGTEPPYGGGPAGPGEH